MTVGHSPHLIQFAFALHRLYRSTGLSANAGVAGATLQEENLDTSHKSEASHYRFPLPCAAVRYRMLSQHKTKKALI